ncbi:synaptotagmin-like protein 2 isoform X1 [Pygocentrus nattereri]|uniref:synaptotagmin-like protein 2 isoform X1 n=1 Tax=Pygocentrus nattereri TaxID=42514 RepID=UPI001891B5B7|nr:synaptotagmin-like protein 2 isoform X1 [Pygocentrus nattereri]
MSPTQEEIKAKPSPKPRRGLLALFSRAETKADSPETLLTKEDVVHHPDDKKDNIISESLKAPHIPTNPEVDDISDVQSSSKLNVVTEEHEASVLLSKTEDSGALDDVDDDNTPQKESVDHGERSPSRLASLKSFWERGNKGPKILSIKKSADTNQGEMPKLSEEENKDMDPKLPGINVNPFKANTSFGSSECPEDKSSHERIGDGADASVPSYEEKSLTFDINQITQEPEEHGLQTEISSEEPQSSPVKQKEQEDEIPHPVPLVRKLLTQQDIEPATISNLKSFWEKEASGPKITVSTPESPDVQDAASLKKHSKKISESSLEVGSTSLDPVVGPERRKSSLTREAGMIMLSLKEKIEKSQRKQSPSKVPVKSPQDDTDRISHSTHHISPLKTLKAVSDKGQKRSPRSSPIRNISSGVLDHDHQSGDDNLTAVLTQTRTPSPRHQPKVTPRDSFPVKESRKNGSPLRAFIIDVNPTEEVSAECLEHTSLNRDQIGYPAGQSHTDKSSPISDEKDLAEQNLKVTPQQSPPSSPGRFQSSGRISIGNIGGIQISPVHSSPSSQGQTSACLTSPEHRRKTSDEGSDGSPIMLKERKRLDDFQPNIRLARSYIPLSYQHYLGLPESTHKSGCSDQPIRQEWIRVEVGEGSEQVSQGRASNESSPSRCSQPESEEITFDSSRSASPDAWSQSRTSSVCGSVEPSPVRTALKQANVRPISISKSLENLASLPSREERWKNEPRTDITLSVEDVSAAPLAPSSSLSDPEQMKMLSVSVPAFIQQQRNGRGSDCTSVNSFYSERQRKDSTNTYLSTSSGRASLSSVSGSVMSIYSTDFGNVEVKGTIQFAINYVPKLGEFHIFIAQCRDLAAAEPKRNRSDPYVKCYLLPDKARLGKRKTTVKKKTLNPAYNEILRYKIPLENLKAHTLNLSVWHNDTFGRNSFLGEVDVDLSEWDFNNTHMMDYALKGRVPAQMSPKRVNHCMEMSGEMRVALRFLQQTSQSKKTPQTGEVQIWVKECKDLPAREGAIDPFVKCTVLPDTARKSRQKTRVVKRTANPVFNHTMVYDGFRPEDLREACVELTVWDHDRLNNHFIGGIRLCLGTGKSYGNVVDWMDSNSAEAGLWKRMIESQNEWVEDVVPLRMLVMARTMSK